MILTSLLTQDPNLDVKYSHTGQGHVSLLREAFGLRRESPGRFDNSSETMNRYPSDKNRMTVSGAWSTSPLGGIEYFG